MSSLVHDTQYSPNRVTVYMSHLAYKCPGEFAKIKQYIDEREILNTNPNIDGPKNTYEVLVKYKFWNLNIFDQSEIDKWTDEFPKIHESVRNEKHRRGFPYESYTISKADYEHMMTLAQRYKLSVPKLGTSLNKYADREFKKITKFSLADEKDYDRLISHYTKTTNLTEDELHVVCNNLYGVIMIEQLKTLNKW